MGYHTNITISKAMLVQHIDETFLFTRIQKYNHGSNEERRINDDYWVVLMWC